MFLFFQNTASADVEARSDDEDPQPAIGESDDENSDVVKHGTDVLQMDTKNLSTAQLRAINKLNSVMTIEQLRIVPIEDSRISIPLCRVICMPIMRSTLSCDLTLLEADFVHGYREGAAVFYVSTTDEQGVVQKFNDTNRQTWNGHWRAADQRFEEFLLSKPSLQHLSNVKFFVCDGNHRHQAWMKVISRDHSLEVKWHYSVDSIVLDTKGRIGSVMQVMHDINK
jgi:hypothetical protein